MSKPPSVLLRDALNIEKKFNNLLNDKHEITRFIRMHNSEYAIKVNFNIAIGV